MQLTRNRFYILILSAFLAAIHFLLYKSYMVHRQGPAGKFGNKVNSMSMSQIANIKSDNQQKSSSFINKDILNHLISSAFNHNNLEKVTTLCPLIPPNLGTKFQVVLNNTSLETTELELKNLNINLDRGGLYKPPNCQARYKVAIIVPYRNRQASLNIFTRHMHTFLSKQQLEYTIFLVEPLQSLTFNRGLLMNIGFLESLKLNDWDCFVFHDVDLLPEDERNIYSCPESPRHMSAAVSTFGYSLPYNAIFGGVSSLTKDQMYTVNGYSNLFFGWGGEDDEFRARIILKNLKVIRYPLEIGRYYMIGHKRDQKTNENRMKLLRDYKKNVERGDGIKSIKYDVKSVLREPLFTKIIVSYDENSILKNG